MHLFRNACYKFLLWFTRKGDLPADPPVSILRLQFFGEFHLPQGVQHEAPLAGQRKCGFPLERVDPVVCFQLGQIFVESLMYDKQAFGSPGHITFFCQYPRIVVCATPIFFLRCIICTAVLTDLIIDS